MKDGICTKCNSRKVIPNLSITEDGHVDRPKALSARIVRNPKAFFKDLYSTPLQAWSCGNCGYTELFVENPQELYLAYRVFRARVRPDDPFNEAQ